MMRWRSRQRCSDARLDVNLEDCCYDDEEDPLYGRLDINNATAEELMTLPGINRSTATNVVTYRAHIGGFRKVEDVVLVPGVGATRFGHLRAEIYVVGGGTVDESTSSPVPPPASTKLRRSGSSATSSGIDVSLTPVDSVSRDFVVATAVTTSSAGLQPTSATSTTPALEPDIDACLRPDHNSCAVAERGDGDVLVSDNADRPKTLPLERRRLGRCWPTASEIRRPEDCGAVRVATWNLGMRVPITCSSHSFDDVTAREHVAVTLLENLYVSFLVFDFSLAGLKLIYFLRLNFDIYG